MNFDHPDALDWPLLHLHLQAMAAGLPFEEPVYSFSEYARTADSKRIEPSDFFVIVEGLFVFHWPNCGPCWIPLPAGDRDVITQLYPARLLEGSRERICNRTRQNPQNGYKHPLSQILSNLACQILLCQILLCQTLSVFR